MFRNNLKVAWRSMKRQWGFSIMNICGLAAGLTCCMLSLLYVRDELSFDKFHHDAERIFRIVTDEINNDGQRTAKAMSPRSMGFTLRQDISGIDAICTILPRRPMAMRYEDKLFYEEHVFEADSNFFNVFTFAFLEGSPANAFATRQSIVLTKSAATKYFGSDNPLGKVIQQEHTSYFVSAVVEDVPRNSHFQFDMLIPLRTFGEGEIMVWGNPNFYTYVKLSPDASTDHFNAALLREAQKYHSGSRDQYSLQPLTDIHLHSNRASELGTNGSTTINYLMITLATFILLMAAVNYINLATARASKRAREVGVRKTSGASRSGLVFQFLSESVLTTILAAVIVLLLVPLFQDIFFRISGKYLEIFSSSTFTVWLLFAVIAVGIGILSGLYPAFYLSHFRPSQVLKGTLPVTKGVLRKALVAFQLTMAIALIFGTFVVMHQMNFMTRKDLGFDTENVLLIPNANRIEHRQVLEDRIRQYVGVTAVGASTSAIGSSFWTGNIRAEGSTNDRLIGFCQINYDYFDALNLSLLEGRKFSPEFRADTVNTLILNEQAVRDLGLEDPIGQRLQWDAENVDTALYAVVVGVVSDFHFESLREPIKPFAFLIRNNFFVQDDFTSRLFVRINGNTELAAQQILSDWKELVPDRPFTWSMLTDTYTELYVAESRFRSIFIGLTSVALVIVSLGLIALISFVTEQRTKEIGIRKVLGASITNIVTLINRDFLKLTGIALFIGIPLSIYGMNQWLDTFAYRIAINGWMIALTALCAGAIVILTTGFHSIRASQDDPVKSLKAE